MNLVWIGLALVALGALAGLVQQKWTLPALIGVILGFGLAGYGFFSSQSQTQVIEETVLASDNPQEDTRPTPPPAEGGEMDTAPEIPEHVLNGKAQPWVQDLQKVLANPKSYPLFNSGVAKEGLNKGDLFYEYSNLDLTGRTLGVLFVSQSPDDPHVWMAHIEPGEGRPPIKAQEFGSVAVIGEDDSFIMFQVKDGPFAGDYLVWGKDDQGNGGFVVRLYTPGFLEREHARSQAKGGSSG